MKKVLFVATVQSHIMNFHIPYLKLWQDKGYEVHVATNMDTKKYNNVEEIISNIIWNNIDFDRSPFSKNTFVALKQLIDIMNENRYELVHVHTPVGGILGRMAAKITNTKNVVYTAHGLHFYKGAPKKNWLIYYPIEKIMARYTDAIITINEEDYQLVKNKFKTRIRGNVFKINGVGIDLNKYNTSDTKNIAFKRNLGLDENDFVLSIIGELNDNKNQIQLIKSVQYLKKHCDCNNIKCLVIGDGENKDKLNKYIEDNNLRDVIYILGFRNDIPNLINITDVLVSMSKREGLPKNIMEGMVSGKAIICTNIRGNRDLIKNKINGFLVDVDDIENTKKAIVKLICNKNLLDIYGLKNKEMITDFEINYVLSQVEHEVYDKLNKENTIITI